jgi:hypothetical protein
VFAGKNLQTEATFKTVLLNSQTTSADLVKQSIQRFRLPVAEDEKDYYLTVKQVEGSSAMLLPGEYPLRVFEMLVEAALELPKVKRSSVGSISSVASNLSMHPAIKSLPMNDFTDDSAVKFYLNRRQPDRPRSGRHDHRRRLPIRFREKSVSRRIGCSISGRGFGTLQLAVVQIRPAAGDIPRGPSRRYGI